MKIAMIELLALRFSFQSLQDILKDIKASPVEWAIGVGLTFVLIAIAYFTSVKRKKKK